MLPLPKSLYRAEQVRELDRLAIAQAGCSGLQLMQRAGSAAFKAIRTTWPRGRKIAVLCGVGNNGGDGYVVAKLALDAGLDVTVFTLGDTSRLRGDALTVAKWLKETKDRTRPFAQQSLTGFDVIVDGLLGTGIKGGAKDDWADAINAINHAGKSGSKVLALDIASGLNADTGYVATVAVMAHITVTFIGVKQGLLTADGPNHSGQLLFDDLGVDPSVYRHFVPNVYLIDSASRQRYLPPRAKNTNKADFGFVLVIGGNTGYLGAVRLAGEAALRAGSGRVAIATRQMHVDSLANSIPELMCYGIERARDLTPLLSQATTVVIGPGLGTDDWAKCMLSRVLETELPLVVDADALNLLAIEPQQRRNWVLTPHPGEAARLLKCSTKEVQQDRFEIIKQLQHRYNGVVVLKGSGTLIKGMEGGIYLCSAGNPGMATAGMGDVLAGLTGALVAQGLPLDTGAGLAVYIHACAADQAAIAGERGMIASDLMRPIQYLVNP